MDKLYDQDGNCDTYNYNSTTGYLDSVKDNDTGAQINYTYDENRGQLISVSQTDSYTDITAQNNYTYDESGKLLTKSTIQIPITSSTMTSSTIQPKTK